jgi:DNA-binding transcriptional ArsR family regulator
VSSDHVGTTGIDPGSSHANALHALRIKRVATVDEVAEVLDRPISEVEQALHALRDADLVHAAGKQANRWHLTELGTEEHARLVSSARERDSLREVRLGYEVFLEHNAPLKELMSDWQGRAHKSDELALVVEEIAETHEAVSEGLQVAAREAPRFAVYAMRLSRALERAERGDGRYLADPVLPSYHTVWFECHEDFLVTLGHTRAQESGS